ncbi:VanZ family protein [Clostridium tunisiense]|uniref:VanZ family protein n=1 Tax=Clostridium tunisiense TaxID=219748 RepID=UPI0002E0DA06|nr:VanZ family protein [Clostridium tunisiense]
MENKQMKKRTKLLLWFLFVLYLLVLVNVIIFKDGNALIVAQYSADRSLWEGIEAINFVPFKTIIPYLKGEPTIRIATENILGNIFAFSPLGFLLPLLFKRFYRLKNIFLTSFAISLFIEVIQLVFYLGSTDVDDLILNTLGSLLGFGVLCLLKKISERKSINLSQSSN